MKYEIEEEKEIINVDSEDEESLNDGQSEDGSVDVENEEDSDEEDDYEDADFQLKNDDNNLDKEILDCDETSLGEEVEESESSEEENEEDSVKENEVESKEESESEEESEQESEEEECADMFIVDPDEKAYGSLVKTAKNPEFETVLKMTIDQLVQTAHVTSPKGRKSVFKVTDREEREKLREVIKKKGKGWSWILRQPKKTSKGCTGKGFAEGFSPHPSSDDESIAPEKAKKVVEKSNSKDDKKKNQKKKLNELGKVSRTTGKGDSGASKAVGSSLKKGKQKKVDVDFEEKHCSGKDGEEEDDEDSLFGDVEMKASLKKQVEEKAHPLVPVYVSPPFFDAVAGKYVWIVIYGKPLNTFYAKAEHQRTVIEYLHKRKKLGNVNNTPNWIKSIDDTKIRGAEHGLKSEWYKTKGGNTTELISFVLALPKAEEHTFHEVLSDICENYFGKVFKARKTNSAGELCLSYAESLVDPNRPDKGLYNWLLNAKGKKDPVVAAQVMTKELDDHFKGGPAYHYDVSLDKMLVDWDIKQFLQDHVGINSWEDLDEAGRIACFRDYPTRELPQWDLIMEESY